MNAILEVAKNCLLVLTALFPIVDPLGNIPIFLSLTAGYSSGDRALLSRKIALNSMWLLIGSMLIGTHILKFFGISIPVVQIGGGMVVMWTGWTLLHQNVEQEQEHAQKRVSRQDISDKAFYPLTLPLTVGPGSISVALTLGASQAIHVNGWVRLVAAIVGPALVAFLIYVSYRFAERLARMLGQTAMNVIVRLAAFILLCIGVQVLTNGLHNLFTQYRPIH
ncbi:MAG TPA: MarC family protein [Bryobacteraceae bacterium]|jgi:multiple antibiotic resistance protein|nr:MarC family protein [Bryobacteraceae bacterium]